MRSILYEHKGKNFKVVEVLKRVETGFVPSVINSVAYAAANSLINMQKLEEGNVIAQAKEFPNEKQELIFQFKNTDNAKYVSIAYECETGYSQKKREVFIALIKIDTSKTLTQISDELF